MKKRLSLFLILMLMVSLLAACGEDEDGPKKGKGRNRDTEATPTEQPTDEPTTEPTAKPTAEPTAEPTPEPTPDPGISSLKLDCPNQALLAFGEYLDAKVNTIPEDMRSFVRYGVFLLNADETPELWWAEAGAHANPVNVCIYDGEKVVELGSFGSFGTCRYRRQESIITSGYMGMGASMTDIYTLSGTTITHADGFFSQTIDMPEGSQTNYSRNDVPCTEQEYNEGLAFWSLETMDFIDYEKGRSLYATSPEGYTYEVSTTYTGLYEYYVSMYIENPFFYGIPEDILLQLTGEWKLVGGEVEGWEWNAEEEDITGKWIFEPNGEAEFTEGKTVEMYRLTYDPEPLYVEPLWCVETPRKGDPGYTYYMTIRKDGILEMLDTNPDAYYAAVRYYQKVK